MDETRESRVAAILARGVIRVLQRAERTGARKSQDIGEAQTLDVDASVREQLLAGKKVAVDEQGEHQ